MKEIFYERRMYAGYPVFVMTYFDKDNNRYNYTTSSSMYTLGKMAVLGLSNNNALKCILENGKFSASFPTSKYIDDIELGGQSGTQVDKLTDSNFTLNEIEEIKFIQEAELVYILSVVECVKSEEFDRYTNIVCKIENVYVSDTLYKNGFIDVEGYQPVVFVGTDEGRFYKKLK